MNERSEKCLTDPISFLFHHLVYFWSSESALCFQFRRQINEVLRSTDHRVQRTIIIGHRRETSGDRWTTAVRVWSYILSALAQSANDDFFFFCRATDVALIIGARALYAAQRMINDGQRPAAADALALWHRREKKRAQRSHASKSISRQIFLRIRRFFAPVRRSFEVESQRTRA